jgi:integrase
VPRRSKTPGVFVFQRKTDGRWMGRWTDPASKRRRDVTLETLGISNADERREWAKKKSAELVEQKRRANLGRHGRTHLKDALESVTTAATAERKRPATVYLYTHAGQSLVDWLLARGVRFAEEIQPRDLFRYRTDALKVEVRPATINSHLRCLRAVLVHWRRAHMLPNVPPEEIANACEQIHQDDEPPVPHTPAQIRQLLTRAAAVAESTPREWRFAAAVVIDLLTGMRCGELERLARVQVDLDAPPAGIVRLDAATKTRRGRVIDLSVCPTVRELLRAILEHDAEPYVIGRHKILDRAVSKRWIHQNQCDGWEWSWQTLRQTCESYLVCAPGIGFGVYRGARQVGHSVQTAERYYIDSVRGIPPEARTLEAAMQAEAEFAAAAVAVKGALARA